REGRCCTKLSTRCSAGRALGAAELDGHELGLVHPLSGSPFQALVRRPPLGLVANVAYALRTRTNVVPLGAERVQHVQGKSYPMRTRRGVRLLGVPQRGVRT